MIQHLRIASLIILSQASIQKALGVSINYMSPSSDQIWTGFTYTGDFSYRRYITALERVLNNGVRVALIYGDAGRYHSFLSMIYAIHVLTFPLDYICNWFGGEAVSMEIEYEHAKEFRPAGYVPFMIDGEEYGEVRQYGNFSFLRVYEAGREIPYYQTKASLAFFSRVLGNLALADGEEPVTSDYETEGSAEATHTESFVPLPSTVSSSVVVSSSSSRLAW